MNFGYVKVGAFTPSIKVADTDYNENQIIIGINSAYCQGVEMLVLPELCVTGSTCGDLFFSKVLLEGAKRSIINIAKSTINKNMLVIIGAPIIFNQLIYSVSVVINNGKILGVIPKNFQYKFNDNNGNRYFASYNKNELEYINFDSQNINVPFGKNIIFTEKNNKDFCVGLEIGEELYSLSSPSISLVQKGVNIIANLSSNCEIVGRKEFIENFIINQSKKLCCAYVYANSGKGESTTDMVFAGGNIIAENGDILNKNALFNDGLLINEIDLDYLVFEKSKIFNGENLYKQNILNVEFIANSNCQTINREYKKYPFIPNNSDIDERAKLILDIQSKGLEKRIEHTNAKSLVLGLSGGLDSTLALLVTVRAIKILSRNVKDIIAVTMPCFGTTSRTFDNSVKLAKALGVTLKKVDIAKSVKRHFKDIGHSGELNVTYENAQARERTQVLMDIANMNGGLVVGTGDLSELALGWATYNGDHMSMYAVNCSIPKTLVKCLVDYCAKNSKGKLKGVLFDILDTPVSPELLPSLDNKISQKTEDIVGPYELHDFFMYHLIRRGTNPKKVFYIAEKTFMGEYDKITILKWLKTFIKRFFSQQFKRSCVPDGVKVGLVGFSPRGAYQMPSDAVCSLWLKDIEEMEI